MASFPSLLLHRYKIWAFVFSNCSDLQTNNRYSWFRCKGRTGYWRQEKAIRQMWNYCTSQIHRSNINWWNFPPFLSLLAFKCSALDLRWIQNFCYCYFYLNCSINSYWTCRNEEKLKKYCWNGAFCLLGNSHKK